MKPSFLETINYCPGTNVDHLFGHRSIQVDLPRTLLACCPSDTLLVEATVLQLSTSAMPAYHQLSPSLSVLFLSELVIENSPSNLSDVGSNIPSWNP